MGTDSPTLSLISLALASAGSYSVTVTNPYGSAQSQTNYLQVLTPSPYVAAVVQDSPQNLWPLNETVPATAYDYWSGQNGTQNGTLTLGVAGPTPPAYQGFSAGTTAYEFDGASAYIDCGTGPALSGTTDFTLEAWVNTTSTAAGVIIQQRYWGLQWRIRVRCQWRWNPCFYGVRERQLPVQLQFDEHLDSSQ